METIGEVEKLRRDVGMAPEGRTAEDVVSLDEEENARVAAFEFEPVWEGREVLFSFSKEALFLQLRKAMGAPSFSECWDDVLAFLADAVRIVWLGIHGPAEFRDVRGDLTALQERMDAWADGIPREKQVDLVRLAKQVWNAAGQNAAEPVGDGRPGKAESGN